MPVLNLTVLASLLVSTAALAQVATPAAPIAAAPVKEKKICRSEVALGSIMSKRVCMTKSEWVALRAKSGATAEQALRNISARGDPSTAAQ